MSLYNACTHYAGGNRITTCYSIIICRVNSQAGFCVIVSAESYSVTSDAYINALAECKKTAKKVEDKYVAKMEESKVLCH